VVDQLTPRDLVAVSGGSYSGEYIAYALPN